MTANRTRDELEKRVEELEAMVEALVKKVKTLSDPTPSDPQGGDPDPEPDTPVEQLSKIPEEELANHATESDQRAITLWKKLPEWGKKTSRGLVLKTKNNLRNLLASERDEQLAWKQVYRACRALSDLAKEKVEWHEDHPRHGKMLVVSVSSAGGG